MEQSSNEKSKNCIMQYRTRLKEILQRLEWSEEVVLKDFNTNSMASSVMDIVKKPHSPKVATYPDSCITNNSLVLDTTKLQEILQNNKIKAPRNFTELQANLSREQKLKIYEHVVENTEKLENNTVSQVDKGEISFADIFAQKKREENRKKRKFCKSKPTHIEEVRCLVDLQMQALQQFVSNKIIKDEDITARSDISRRISRDERKRYEDYYKRDKFRDRSVDRINVYDYSRRDRSRGKERKRYHRSRSQEISYERKIHNRSHNKEKRKRSQSRCKERRSRCKEIAYKRTGYSTSQSKEILKDGRTYCSSKDISKQSRTHRSRSKDMLKKKRKRSRSRSKDRKYSPSFCKEIVYKKIRHSRSLSNEITYKRGSKEISSQERERKVYHEKNFSKRDYESADDEEKRLRNVITYKRRIDSGSKEISKNEKEENVYSKKYFSKRDYENDNEKRRHCNAKHNRRLSKSPEKSSSKRRSLENETKNTDYNKEYARSHKSRSRQHGTIPDKDKYYRQSTSSYQSTEEILKYKSYQHKSMKKDRNRS